MRIADRLKSARRRYFVGRTAEKALFQSALASQEPPFYILYVYGPGGVGKTTLLHEFADIAQQHNAGAIYLDTRNIEPTPAGFASSLAQSLGGGPAEDPLNLLHGRSQRTVLLFDTCETLAPLDNWLRDDFLPEMPATTLTVMAGRSALGPAWHADPGWHNVLEVVPLRNLAPNESLAYLDMRTVPAAEQERIVEFTHGHPLAISLVADVLDQQPEQHFEPIAVPNLIQALLERLVQESPSPLHQKALEASCLALYMTEALLAHMLNTPNVHTYFEWLRGLSLMEAGRFGLFPHDLVRETMVTDLHWRNPDLYVELHHRARLFYHARLRQTSGYNQRRLLAELVFLHRDNAVVRAALDFQVNDNLFTDNMRVPDAPKLVEMVRRHEGEASAQLAAHWLECQPHAALVIRDQFQEPQGFVMVIALHDARPEDVERDPATRAARQYIQRQTPPRPGEQVLYFRFWMESESYQAFSAAQGKIFLNIVQLYLNTAGLTYTFLPCAQPDSYYDLLTYADINRVPQLDFVVEGRSYGVFCHDWRICPPAAWLDLMAEREIAYSSEQALPSTSMPVSPSLLVLSQPEFAQSVRDSLRHFTRPDELQANALVRSRLVVDRAGNDAAPAVRARALRDAIEEAVNLLQSSPRQLKLYRALYHTYLQPAATQELAAELLDLPFSTYRRHLKEGIENVVETLWARELGTQE